MKERVDSRGRRMKETGLLSIELYWSGSHLSDVCVCAYGVVYKSEREEERERAGRTDNRK